MMKQCSYVENPVQESSISDLNYKRILEYLRLVIRLDATVKLEEEVVLKLILGRKIAVRVGNEIIPTVGSILIFAKDPKRFLPCCGIVFTRYSGKTLTAKELITSCTFQSTISQTLFSVVKMINAVDYPPNVVREVLINALVHRDYSMIFSKILVDLFSDRIEVQSPGLLPNGLTVENMRAGYPVHRNPLLSNYVHCLKLDEQAAGGLPKIISQMKQLGREVEIKIENPFIPFIRVTIEGPRRKG